MSKLKLDKINFDDDDFVVEVSDNSSFNKFGSYKKNEGKKQITSRNSEENNQEDNETEIEKKIKDAQEILNNAQLEAQEILQTAQNEVNELISKTNQELDDEKIKILEEAQKNADEILATANENSKKEINELIENSKAEIEQSRIQATTEGYNEGYKDGLEKIQEELQEKIEDFNKFCSNQLEVKEKILKSASKDVLNLIINISKKILFKELDAQIIDKIIKNAISNLEKKENINIILSEKYAKLLYEFQKKSLNEELEFNFEDFKQYEGFEIVYNSKFDDDTIIVENLKERFDASISTQLDVLIRNIYENSQNGQIEIEEYIEKDET